ncbi:MAG: hypothetical protein IPL32_10540 [Chloracidobacterium sp.]|nr:hypothetical protein [Chloracidobacterium sp.]
MKTERIFQILAVILVCIAAYFLYMENKDGVFVSVVLAACSFFMSVRFQSKARLRQNAAESSEEVLNK